MTAPRASLSVPCSSVTLRTALALAYQALGQRAQADAALQELLTQDTAGGAYQIAVVN